MKAGERDELLVRLDERCNNIHHHIEKIERHLSKLNDKAANAAIRVGVNRRWLSGISGIVSTIVAMRFLGIF
jgi:hypothetical protein|tara:strand:+ start:430 stop:645 length:216 start_codon:yes stop_codon:yes gene_type:complete